MADVSGRLDDLISKLQGLNTRVQRLQEYPGTSIPPQLIATDLQDSSDPISPIATDVQDSSDPTSPRTKSLQQQEAIASKDKDKYSAAFEDEVNVISFFGQDIVDTEKSDFDMVLVFSNPAETEEFSRLFEQAWRASSKVSPHYLQAVKHKKQLEEDEVAAEEKFKDDLFKYGGRLNHQQASKWQLRCKKCKTLFPPEKSKVFYERHDTHELRCPNPECGESDYVEAVLLRCKRCAMTSPPVTGDTKTTKCRICRSTDLEEFICPVATHRKKMNEKIVGPTASDLLRGFFIDPMQGKRIDISSDIKNLKDARTAAIDIFLSFFRAQQDEDYYTYLFKSVDLDDMFLCIKMVEKTAVRHAKRSRYNLMLDSNKMCQSLDDGGLGLSYTNRRAPKTHKHLSKTLSKMHSFVNNRVVYLEQHLDLNPELQGGAVTCTSAPGMEKLLTEYEQECEKGEVSILKKVDRIRLLYDRVTDVINLEEMMSWGLLSEFYPLHTLEALTRLKKEWAQIGKFYTADQPMYLIRDYFGENIALYFVFLEVLLGYLLCLVCMSVVFTAVQIAFVIHRDGKLILSTNNVLRLLGGKEVLPTLRILYALGTIVCCQCFCVRLRRIVHTKFNVWGLDTQSGASSVKAEVNPRFNQYATITASDLNENELEINVEWQVKTQGRVQARVITGLFIAFASACTLGILYCQAALARTGNPFASFMSYVLTVEIKVLTAIWGKVGTYLVDHEYWRTSIKYDNSIAYKNFLVQLITSFAAFLYIAFFMKALGDHSYCGYAQYKDVNGEVHNCKRTNSTWGYLTYQMIIVFGTYMAFCVFDLFSPLLTLYRSKANELKKVKDIREEGWKYSFIESQAKMSSYDGQSQNEDYMQILLPCGFVFFFGTALPISACFCWLFASLQLRVDAWKLCHCMKRPFPRATGTGKWIWDEIVQIYIAIATLINIGLVSFTMDPVAQRPFYVKAAAFFGLVCLSYLLNIALIELYPAVSDRVELAQRRHLHQQERVNELYFDKDNKNYMTLRANKDIRFGRGVSRLRSPEYEGSRTLSTSGRSSDVDDNLIFEVFQDASKHFVT